MRHLSNQVWWTIADARELDVLIDTFVGGALVHRERCDVCSKGGAWCHHLREAFEELLAWRTTRMLRSEATWLRAVVDDFERHRTMAGHRPEKSVGGER